MKRPKPKFKVGQVVSLRESEGTYKIKRLIFAGGGWLYDLGTLMSWQEFTLRPLTSREIGPRGRK